MIRLQKLLAAAGLGSRRGIEQWIRDGRITVAGRIAQLGDSATPADEVCLDGRKLDLDSVRSSEREVLVYHKPVGEMTTRRDPQGRPTVFERLPPPRQGRWISVGRLDVNTSGLLLLTTDGELAHRLMHPSSEIDREYLVRVRGRPSSAVLQSLLAGVSLDDGPARFDRIEQAGQDRPDLEDQAIRAIYGARGAHHEGAHSTFRVVLHEGRNREVRRLWSAVGFEVSRLMRIRYGSVELPRDLKPGGWRIADALASRRLAQSVHLFA